MERRNRTRRYSGWPGGDSACQPGGGDSGVRLEEEGRQESAGPQPRNRDPLGSGFGLERTEASVKWLTRIDVLTEPYTGEFQVGH